MRNMIYFIFLLLFMVSACRDVKEVKTYRDLISAKEIIIVTTDSSVYKTQNFTVMDNSITITGRKEKNYQSVNYEGDIPFENILYIQTGEEELFPAYFKTGVTAVFLIAGHDVFSEDKLTYDVHFIYPSGSSCPLLYSWDGDKFSLEGETFGTSLGRALETETSVILSSLTPEAGKVKIKFTNERPETHFFNTIRMYAVKSGADQLVITDSKNRIKIVNEIKNISMAEDQSGKDITDLLVKDDQFYWRSDLSSACSKKNYEDLLYVNIKTPADKDSVSILISARNTDISSVVFQILKEQLGNDFIAFSRAAETDPELTGILKETLQRSALKIDTWDGSHWQHHDTIFPEASAVDFKKLVTLPVVNQASGVTKIRLRALTDVWQLNSICYSKDTPESVILEEAELINCSSDFNRLNSADDLYIKLLPGETIELEYKEIRSGEDAKVTYIARARGYLYENIINPGGGNIAGLDLVSSDFPGLGMVKSLLKNSELFYPVVYSRWREQRSLY